MDKRFLAVIGVIIVVFVGIVAFGGKKSDTKTTGDASQATNHVIGNTASKVTLVEYGDYECPVCEGYFPVTQQVQEKYKDTVKFQFRNLPLSSIHPNAVAGARAAEAADLQGKFWEMHDALYEPTNWNTWSTASGNTQQYFNEYAQKLGLNLTKFKTDFASSEVNDRIQADTAAFAKTGQQQATPTFFLNGKYVANSSFADSNGPSVTAFSKVLDEALKNAK